MINVALKRSLQEILEKPRNVIVNKSDVSGNSIEVEYRHKSSFDSFCYYEKVKDRDSDLKELIELLTEKNKQNEK